jgi:hypothetical protein
MLLIIPYNKDENKEKLLLKDIFIGVMILPGG